MDVLVQTLLEKEVLEKEEFEKLMKESDNKAEKSLKDKQPRS